MVLLLDCSCGCRPSGKGRQPSSEAPLRSPAGCSGSLQPSCLKCSACGSSCRQAAALQFAWHAVAAWQHAQGDAPSSSLHVVRCHAFCHKSHSSLALGAQRHVMAAHSSTAEGRRRSTQPCCHGASINTQPVQVLGGMLQIPAFPFWRLEAALAPGPTAPKPAAASAADKAADADDDKADGSARSKKAAGGQQVC